MRNNQISEKPKRSLGQNFFVNQSQAQRIVSYTLESKPEFIIEIGPGTGSFTQLLAKSNAKLFCIEKDNQLYENLKIIYPNATIFNEDFLDINLPKFFEENRVDPSKTVFYGSLPYNISKKIIEQCLTTTTAMALYFIIQKEVADKYCAIEPDNNIISIYAHLFSKPSTLLSISPESFSPRPNVTSAFIRFVRDQKNKYANLFLKDSIKYNEFMKFVHSCFRQPRKTLRNNLKPLVLSEENEPNKTIMGKRPQELSLDEFIRLYTSIYKI